MFGPRSLPGWVGMFRGWVPPWALDLGYPVSPPTYMSATIPLWTCLNLLYLDQNVQGHMVCKQTVCILLEWFLITARKQSLRMLRFYTCLSVILFTVGVCLSACWDSRPPRSRSLGSTHPPVQCMLGDTANKRAVRILLECILAYLFVFLPVLIIKLGHQDLPVKSI